MYYFQNMFQKKFCCNVSISENKVKTQWMVKAALNYRNFISKIKKKGFRPGYVPEDVWEKWIEHWESAKSIRKSEINSQNHRAGREIDIGPHTNGSISIGEHRKKHIYIMYKLYN